MLGLLQLRRRYFGDGVVAVDCGAAQLIAPHHPIILLEHIKAGADRMTAILNECGNTVYRTTMNLLAIHPEDQTGTHIRTTG